MPTKYLKDSKDKRSKGWKASLHSEPYRLAGPANQEDDRHRKMEIDGKSCECFLGEPQKKLKNGQLRGGTRVNINIDNQWWHITKSDQPKINGKKPNLYEEISDSKKVYEFTRE